MNRILFAAALSIGALAILWIGRIFWATDLLGLGITILIAGVYAIGTWELLQFRKDTASLSKALLEMPSSDTENAKINDLESWLNPISPNLHNTVRLRVEGQRTALPAPILTPYLVGLLVMLGLLGTFVGMVDTLKGAVIALEGSSELEAIRAGLAAPIEGLGLAFGTSVAGVAASAMLGLLSTLSRRDRLKASHLLDTKASQHLREFSANHNQRMAFQAIQDQAQALPAVAEKLGTLALNLEGLGEQIGERLLSNQTQFQESLFAQYQQLTESVDQSLKASVMESSKLIHDTIEPIAHSTLTEIKDASLATLAQLTKLSEQQMSSLNSLAENNSNVLSESVTGVVKTVHDNSQTLLSGFDETRQEWAKQQQTAANNLSAGVRKELALLRDEESRRGEKAVAHLGSLETTVATQLAELGTALEEPMSRLIETASKTPKAAADVIEKLRDEMSKNLERDNGLLDERARLMEQLNTLTTTLENSAKGQQGAIDSLLDRSAKTLSEVGAKFSVSVVEESSKLAGIVDHFASSSADMASLGDAFNAAVMKFSESNLQLVDNLNRIESSLEKSTSRSDEQLAYYVSQAREIIDHNLLSHQKIVAALNSKTTEQLSAIEAG